MQIGMWIERNFEVGKKSTEYMPKKPKDKKYKVCTCYTQTLTYWYNNILTYNIHISKLIVFPLKDDTFTCFLWCIYRPKDVATD